MIRKLEQESDGAHEPKERAMALEDHPGGEPSLDADTLATGASAVAGQGGAAGLGDDDWIERVRRVLEVVPGERRLRPRFGCRVHQMDRVHDGSARALAAALVEEALERWVPALEIERVEVLGERRGALRVALWRHGRPVELAVRHRTRAASSARGRSNVGEAAAS